jgi:hypothetical protein
MIVVCLVSLVSVALIRHLGDATPPAAAAHAGASEVRAAGH